MSDHHTKNGSAASEAGVPAETLTAYALDQLSGPERDLVERFLADPAQSEARRVVAGTRRLQSDLPQAFSINSPVTSSELREAMLEKLEDSLMPRDKDASVTIEKSLRTTKWLYWAILGGLACVLVALLIPVAQSHRASARRPSQKPLHSNTSIQREVIERERSKGIEITGENIQENRTIEGTTVELPDFAFQNPSQASRVEHFEVGETEFSASNLSTSPFPEAKPSDLASLAEVEEAAAQAQSTAEVEAKVVQRAIEVSRGEYDALREDRRRGASQMDLYGGASGGGKRAVVVSDGRGPQQLSKFHTVEGRASVRSSQQSQGQALVLDVTPRIILQEEGESKLGTEGFGTEQYAAISDNPFLSPLQAPLSTFSIDVDTASYANVRRFLTNGRLPPPDAVRIEELINYFRYDYPQPKEGEAFSVTMESAECPWQPSHLLLRVGLKGKDIQRGQRPQSNLVFLLDVSGSMADEDKLPLLKTAMQMFTRELGENDRVSIVTYAGEAGLRLPPTRGNEQEKIVAAIEALSSGGSTNGSAGIELAYEQAAAYFVPGGTNRVILCTDGDLNVGITDDESLVRLIKQKAAGGTFLTVLGFGEGNLKDAKMERLADNGNGLYAYIDSVREARKVLVEQMAGSTITIAKDVKIQIEFNPAAIASYRLIGYENRVLAAEDFNDDTKDAGEIGAGHTVTALYELVPAGAEVKPAAAGAKVDPLKYQRTEDGGQRTEDSAASGRREPSDNVALTDAAKTGELLTLKLRYKQPDGKESKLLEHPLKDHGGKFNAASKDLQFAAAVASFGMILRGSEHRGQGNLAAVSEIASGAIAQDEGGYRSEFLDLVRQAQALGAK